MGLFGGDSGGGGVDVSQGVNAVQQGTQQGLSAIQQYYAQAVPALTDYFSQAQSNVAPYTVSGGNANDALYDLLGVARPTAGTYALSSALANQSELSKLVNGTPSTKNPGDLSPSDFSYNYGQQYDWNNTGPADSNFISNRPLANGVSSGWGYSFNTDTGELLYGTHGVDPTFTDPSKIGLKAVQGPNGQWSLQSLGQDAQDATPLTADQQAQWDLIQAYNNGTLGMTDPSAQQNSALAALQQTPGYQFTLQQGLQGVDRSASAAGLLNSGAAIKGAENYASGLAQQTYNTRVGQLAAAAGQGQTAAGTAATLSANLGTGLANAALGTGSNVASLYGSQAQGLSQLYSAQAAAQAQQNSANSSGLFGLAGSVLGMFSDIRLKKDIIPMGQLDNGLPVYEFSYIWDTDERHVGLMAHEVMKVHPEAVFMDESGYYKVNYEEAVK